MDLQHAQQQGYSIEIKDTEKTKDDADEAQQMPDQGKVS